MCYIAQVLHVLIVAFRDQLVDCVLVASTYHIARSAKDIWKTIVSMKYSAKSARYQGLRCFTNWVIFTRYHHMCFTYWLDISLPLHVISYVSVYRTVKNDALNDVLHSITSCLKLRCPWPNSTPLSKRWSTHVNTPSRTSFETLYSNTGTDAFVLL